MRYKEIKNRIKKRYEDLPKNQKIIADFFIDNFDRVPFLSVNDVSEATSRSVASIVRFAQRIGFSGYQEMKENIATNLQSQIHDHRIFSLLDQSKIKDDTLTSVANLEINNINKSLNQIDRRNFCDIVNMIINSERVYTAGLGISYLLAEILSYQLYQIGIKSINFTHNYASFPEQAVHLNKTDCIIFFSFPPYSNETILTAEYAKEKKIKVIALTNKDAAPINKFTDLHISVMSENMLFTNSFAAISVLINALVTECAVKNKSGAKRMLDDLNKLVESQNLVITQ